MKLSEIGQDDDDDVAVIEDDKGRKFEPQINRVEESSSKIIP